MKTPAQRWADARNRYRDICGKIIGLSPDIRYVGAVNQYGRTLAGMLRPNTRPYLRPEQARDELAVVSSLVNLRMQTAPTMGRLKCAVFYHAKVTIVILQKSKMIYYISVDSKNRDIAKLVQRMGRLV